MIEQKEISWRLLKLLLDRYELIWPRYRRRSIPSVTEKESPEQRESEHKPYQTSELLANMFNLAPIASSPRHYDSSIRRWNWVPHFCPKLGSSRLYTEGSK